tara:strand:- start:4564 stop:4896 length:333 start_codon:yes stop_codon:yes gene_type:complete
MASYVIKKATIAASATSSDAVDTDSLLLCGVIFPGTFQGTAITFKYSTDGSTWMDVKETDGSAVSYTASDGDVVRADPSGWAFASSGFLQIVSGSTESAQRIVHLIFRAS